jgi:tRNA 2-thiouridine synthesizing protein A
LYKKILEKIMAEYNITKKLDCTGMLCPLPVVKTNKAIKEIEVDEILEMVATDAGSIPDMEAWARQTNHELLEAKDEGNSNYRFIIKKTH